MTTPMLYSIIRYAPYVETEEFANVGVVICTPKKGQLIFRLTQKNDAKIKSFFRDVTLFNAIKPAIENELKIASKIAKQLIYPEKVRDFFFTFTEPRESLIFYSSTRLLMALDSQVELNRLYNQFVRQPVYSEKRKEDTLVSELRKRFQSYSELKNIFKNEEIGGELTKFRMPLVAKADGKILCAVKPLAFNQNEPSKMLEHCDSWVSRIKRAVRENVLNNKNVLFPIYHSNNLKKAEQKAIDEIKFTLDNNKIFHLNSDDEQSIIDFAKNSLAIS